MSTNVTLNITLMYGIIAAFLVVVGGEAVAAIRRSLRQAIEADPEAIAMETVAGALMDSVSSDAPNVDDGEMGDSE